MIVITAPTGQIGRRVVQNLLSHDEPLRVVVRDPSRLSAAVRDRVEIVVGSHADREVCEQAFKGADSVFWLLPPNPRADNVDAAYSGFTQAACQAFKSQNVQRVVGISALGRGVSDHAGLVTASLAMDDLIARSGVHYRALTLPSFMDNLLRQVEPIRAKGMFFGPIAPDLKSPTCSMSDIAAAAARLLLDHAWTGSGSLSVLGPEDLSFNDMATIMSDVLGKPVRFQQMPDAAFKAMLMERGSSEAMAQATLEMMMAKNAGLDNAEPRTAGSSSPTSFRQWCEETLKPAVLG